MRGLLIAVCAVLALATSGAAAAGNGTPVNASANALTVAVIGDSPYGPEQLAQFPALVDDVNDDAKVDLVLHLGDIKSGSTLCADDYFSTMFSLFETFKDPLVYTPGDNEWTDCHRPNNGGYNPLERLAKVRSLFFADPGTSLGGRKKQVLVQAGYPENQRWLQSRVVFSVVHVVGSNNNLAPWTNETPAQRDLRIAEANARIGAALAWVDSTFELAEDEGARGVVLGMQADTFFGANETATGFASIVSRIEQRAAAFGGPVLLLQGDTHVFGVDHPLAGAPNLTRIVVQGETASEWLRLTVDPRADELFVWERMQV
ncbi:MAG TPA: metallophosphoesterase [Gaiellaceae bacterium]|nr:metallophosphoesterase [Gaiellaceae bacterium]